MKPATVIWAGLLVLSCCASSVYAETWYIKPDGTGEVPTIQAGVDTAAAGDTVLLAPGVYTGVGNRDIMIWDKDVSVISEAGAESTVMNCEGAARGFYIAWDVTNAAVISGLTIENGYDAYHGGAIMIYYSAAPRIEHNIIRNCTSGSDGGGIFSGGNSNPVMLDNLITGCTAIRGGGLYLSRCWSNAWFAFNTVTDNTATLSGGGMYLWDAWPRIYNNTICENDAPSGAGIFLTRADSHPTIDNTIIAFNTQGEAIVCDSDALPLLRCCDFYGNAGGDAMCGEDGGNNFSADPEFCGDSGGYDYWLWDTSPCAIENSPCAMFIGARPVGCEATAIIDDIVLLPGFRLMPNYPNPFNPSTTIAYAVPAGTVHLAIFDVRGGAVAVLRDGFHEEGEHRVIWDGRGRDGAPVAGGVYFIRLTAGGQTLSRKILLLK